MPIRSLLFAAAALALTGFADARGPGQPSPAIAHDAHPLDQLVAMARAEVPREFGPGLTLVEARREDAVAIFVIEGPAEVFSQLTPQQVATHVARGFCGNRGASLFFQRGYRLRVDLRSGSRLTAGVEIDRCPA